MPNRRPTCSPVSTIALLAALAAAPLATPAAAQDAAPENSVTLPTLILSGGLTPVPQDEYGRAATVVGGQTLRDQGVDTLEKALREVPGIAVNATDLSDSVVRIRGHNGAQTLVLVDGVEQIADLGGTRIGGFSMDDIDRIEVLRGPQAASYGIGASGGVVAIWTRRGAEGLHYGASVEGGDAKAASAYVSQRTARGGVILSADWRDDKGWDLSGEGGEKDGLRHRGLRLSGDWAATEDVTLGFSLRRSAEDYDFDSTSFSPASEAAYIYDDRFPHGSLDRRQGQLWVEWRAMDGRMVHRLSYDAARDDRETAFSASFPATRTKTDRRALRYRLSYALDGQAVDASTQVISLMAERVEDSSPTESRYERATNSLALEYRGEVRPGVSVQLAVRRDANDSYRDATAWNAALAWELPESGVKLHASAGDGRRKPVFYELYGDGMYTLANPDLTPERVRSVDAGVTVPFAGGRGSVDVTAFSERLTDRIAYVSRPDFTGVYENDRGTSRRKGVEVSFDWQATDALSLRGHGTWLDAEDAKGDPELRIPRRSFGLGATWTTADGRGTFGADLRHVAGVRDTDRVAFKPVELDAYTVIDVSGRWAINDRVALTGRIENLTDADHVDAWGYAARGRTIRVGLGANF